MIAILDLLAQPHRTIQFSWRLCIAFSASSDKCCHNTQERP